MTEVERRQCSLGRGLSRLELTSAALHCGLPYSIQLPYILPSLSFASDTSAVPFFASLLAFEVLIVSYWLAIINAWQLMPLTAVSAIFAFFTGKAALGQKMARRIQVESDKRVGIESKKSS